MLWKKILPVVLLAIAGTAQMGVHAQKPANALVLNSIYPDGSIFQLFFNLATRPVIHVEEGNHRIEYQGTSFEVPFDGESTHFSFNYNYDFSGIAEAAAKCRSEVRFDDKSFTVVAAEGYDASVSLYTMDGVCLLRDSVTGGTEKIFDHTCYGQGVYVIAVDSQTVKFIKQ